MSIWAPFNFSLSTALNSDTGSNIVILYVNPLNPKIKIRILICRLYSFTIEVVGRSSIKYQANTSCVIMSVILMTCVL